MPDDLTDARPGPVVAVPSLPGRPYGLQLDAARERVPFPGLHELARAGMRGRLLHFFANHELLATELMALALLRFPDADPRFRVGLVRTIAEEQRHLTMYHARMQDDGVELGEIPVSPFFWDCLSKMEAPIDFVTGMSLTFEQANLDFSRFYAGAFREIGDVATADVLDVVYREEIGHVKHGLMWFERMRDDVADVSTFDAWVKRLPSPLTPVRARGGVFDEEGRRLAGFSEDYITRVRVIGASRGRPPGLWYFNPSCDHRWLHGDMHPQTKGATAVERDFDLLPMFLAATDDVVAVQKEPSTEFLIGLQSLGFKIPAIALQHGDGPMEVDARQLSSLHPWGWSDDMARRLGPLGKRLIHEGQPLAARADIARRVNRKSFAVEVLLSLVVELDDARVSAAETVGVSFESAEAAFAEVQARWEAGDKVVIKADHGTSGRNMIRVRDEADIAKAAAWLRNAFKHQPAVVIEPWLDRVADLSVLSKIDGEGCVTHEGITRFLSDRRGQYRGAVLGKPTFGLDAELVRFFHDSGRDPSWVDRTLRLAAERVGAALHARGYIGPFGVDAFIHRVDGALRLRPLVEVNARYTMGNVALGLSKQLDGGVHGYWWIVRASDVGDLATFVAALTRLAPPTTTGAGTQLRIISGAVFTTEPTTAEAYLSLMTVASDPETALAPLREAAHGTRLTALLDELR